MPLLRDYKSFMVVVGRGCGLIRGSRLRIFDFEYKVRWYLIESLVSRIFRKVSKKVVSLILYLYKEVWCKQVRILKIFSRGFYDHGELFKDRPRGDFLRLNSIKFERSN